MIYLPLRETFSCTPAMLLAGAIFAAVHAPNAVLVTGTFAWGIVACAGYDLFRLPTIYVFHLWGDFFDRIGGC